MKVMKLVLTFVNAFLKLRIFCSIIVRFLKMCKNNYKVFPAIEKVLEIVIY